MSDNKNLSIQLKMQKAQSSYAEVPVLIENSFLSTATNRLYYACFYATKALLLTKDIFTKTHSGVSSMLQKHFVNEGTFDANKAALFSKLMLLRLHDDYDDLPMVDTALITSLLIPGKEYIEYIQRLITDYLHEHQQ